VQHQAGACVRADIHQFKALADGHARLERELAKLQQRCQALVQEKAEQAERHEQLLMQARALAIGKDTEIHKLRTELAQLQAAVPELESRKRLANRVAQLEEREQALRAQLAELKAARATPAPPKEEAAPPIPPAPLEMPVRLVNRSVLCVGGRDGNVPSYRTLIERAGGQFAHHDGGLKDSSSLLDASLAAADLVICQTGCISHAAYWRVKDHCKRTGKRCVFIDNPSISSLARGLQEAEPVLPEAGQ
jgi:multidrug efflux pump subunit AcrA (membrane-fusion protein)